MLLISTISAIQVSLLFWIFYMLYLTANKKIIFFTSFAKFSRVFLPNAFTTGRI